VDEPTLWASLNAIATGAFDFWNNFIGLLMDPNDSTPLDSAAIGNLRTIIRAVSWVESKHGTAGTAANFPARDPMQSGNPTDVWWDTVIGNHAQTERFVRSPGLTPNYWAEELPGIVSALGNFPPTARLSNLGDYSDGHKDANFDSYTSFYWGVPFLIQKINKIPSGATFKCGDASKGRMIDGAVAYNGGGDPQYQQKIEDAWTLITGPKRKRASLTK